MDNPVIMRGVWGKVLSGSRVKGPDKLLFGCRLPYYPASELTGFADWGPYQSGCPCPGDDGQESQIVLKKITTLHQKSSGRR